MQIAVQATATKPQSTRRIKYQNRTYTLVSLTLNLLQSDPQLTQTVVLQSVPPKDDLKNSNLYFGSMSLDIHVTALPVRTPVASRSGNTIEITDDPLVLPAVAQPRGDEAIPTLEALDGAPGRENMMELIGELADRVLAKYGLQQVPNTPAKMELLPTMFGF